MLMISVEWKERPLQPATLNLSQYKQADFSTDQCSQSYQEANAQQYQTGLPGSFPHHWTAWMQPSVIEELDQHQSIVYPAACRTRFTSLACHGLFNQCQRALQDGH